MENYPTTIKKFVRAALSGAALVLVSATPLHAEPLPAPDSGAVLQSKIGRPEADMKGAGASDDVKRVADWIVRTNKQNGHPFIIADKANGLLFAFLENGVLLARSRALYGAMRSDAMTQEQADKTMAELAAADMITPAGIFPAHGYHSPSYGASIRFAEYANSNLLIHRAPAEWRRKNLEASGKARVHVTYGCINVLPEFMDNVLLPAFSGESTIFIMPELESPKTFFAIDDTFDAPLHTATK